MQLSNHHRITCYCCLNFAFQVFLDKEFETPKNEFCHWKTLAAGGTAGLAGSVVSCPSEHIRTKMQLQRRAQLAAKMGLRIQVGVHHIRCVSLVNLMCISRVT